MSCLTIDESEPINQCKFPKITNSNFCKLHSRLTNPVIYKNNISINFNNLPTFSKSAVSKNKKIINNKETNVIDKCKNQNDNNHENLQNITDNLNMSQEKLNMKSIILVKNYPDKKYLDNLIGPIINNVTMSDDDCDPITMDVFWIEENGKRIPKYHNKYMLFSYYDNSHKLRTFTIHTIKDMISNNIKTHPLTYEEINEIDYKRAIDLINLYTNTLGLFKNEINTNNIEFMTKSRVLKLFNKFNSMSIYLQSEWFLNLDNIDTINKLITELFNLTKQNMLSINSTLTLAKIKESKIFQWKYTNNSTLNQIQNHLLDDFEALISLSENTNNQIMAWIIVGALAKFIPEIKNKYPDLVIEEY